MKFSLEKFSMSGFKLGSIGLESRKPVLAAPSVSLQVPEDWVRPSLGTSAKDALRPQYLRRKAQFQAEQREIDMADLQDANFNVEIFNGTITGDFRWRIVESYFAIENYIKDYSTFMDFFWQIPSAAPKKQEEPSLVQDLFPDEYLVIENRKNIEAFFELERALK